MSIDIDILQQFFAAINRNDVEAACQDLAPDVVRVEPPGFPTSGTYRGIAAFKQQFVTGRGQWAEGACTPEQFLQNGNKIVAYVHVLVRLQGASDWVDARIADGFIIREGKIAEFITFPERSEALRWAGIQIPQAP